MKATASREREKAEQAERIERGIKAFEAAQERLKREREGASREASGSAPSRVAGEHDGAAEPGRAVSEPVLDREPTRAAPPTSSPAEYVLTFGKYKGLTIGEVAGLEEMEGADYLEWLRGALRETLAAMEIYLTSQLYLDPDEDEDEDDGEADDFRKHHLGYDHHAPACVKARYPKGDA